LNQIDISPAEFSLEARDLSVVLGGRKVLDVPSFAIKPNGVVVIIGPNGSGKTTLLLVLALLLKPAEGNIYYRGKPVTDAAESLRLRRRFAVLFQEPLLLSGTVWDNVTLGLRLRHTNKEEIKLKAKHWLERFGISDLAHRQSKSLSGGEAKRVSLARAFVLEPEVLFLDEPFAALDTPTHQNLVEDFQAVLHETKVSTVMVTHQIEEALILADRVAVLMNGSIRQIGSAQEVFSSPIDEDVAAFTKGGNILHGNITSQSDGLVTVEVGNQSIEAVSELTVGNKIAVFLHYDDITISNIDGMACSSARNRLLGMVTRVFPLGSQVRVTIDCSFPLTVLITRRSYNELGLEIGRKVLASFKATAVRVLKRLEN
jgi:tungstate transport system ATP-binding protein